MFEQAYMLGGVKLYHLVYKIVQGNALYRMNKYQIDRKMF